jgi:hypothetical protein
MRRAELFALAARTRGFCTAMANVTDILMTVLFFDAFLHLVFKWRFAHLAGAVATAFPGGKQP